MKKKILVVDDDRQILNALSKLLQADGYEVLLADNGQKGVEIIDKQGIDLVLLDLNLPDKSGWDIFERITRNDPFIPVIIVTGRENQFDTALAAGASALMEKPLDIPVLLETITEVLSENPEIRLLRLVGGTKHLRHANPYHPID